MIQMKISYSTIKIPTVLILLLMGTSGFLGFASFFGSVFQNEIIGYVAGCIGFTIIVIGFYHMGKANYQHRIEQEKKK